MFFSLTYPILLDMIYVDKHHRLEADTIITSEQRDYIIKTVDHRFFDSKKLCTYMELHDVCGNEIFMYCSKNYNQGRSPYAPALDDPSGYAPLPVDVFLRRMPFYFYVDGGNDTDKKEDNDNAKDDMKGGTLHHLYASISDLLKSGIIKIEDIYSALEFLYYECKLSLSTIFNYHLSQRGSLRSSFFFDWVDYLHICKNNNISLDENASPDRFITAYNKVLITVGRPPIIYPVYKNSDGTYFRRVDSTLIFTGSFPCEKDGTPIMEWIGIDVKAPMSVLCTCEKSRKGELIITPSSSTSITVSTSTGDEKVYSSPLNISFSPQVLRKRRRELKYTQQQVADAIGVSVRSYQKWEQGEYEPPATALLRLLSWLDLQDISSIITYNEE